jgi:hypothetical protein
MPLSRNAEEARKNPGRPSAMILTPAGKIYFSTLNNGLFSVDLKNKRLVTLIEEGHWYPKDWETFPHENYPALAIDSVGNLLIANKRDGCIERLNFTNNHRDKVFCQ